MITSEKAKKVGVALIAIIVAILIVVVAGSVFSLYFRDIVFNALSKFLDACYYVAAFFFVLFAFGVAYAILRSTYVYCVDAYKVFTLDAKNLDGIDESQFMAVCETYCKRHTIVAFLFIRLYKRKWKQVVAYRVSQLPKN